MSFDVFLSYNRKNQAAVVGIAERLKAAGVKPWLDIWELQAGQNWHQELERLIGTVEVAAVFFGPDGLGPWQDLEAEALVGQLVDRGCRVIPVILRECRETPRLPLFLRSFGAVDFRDQKSNPLLRLIAGINGRRIETEEPKPVLPLNNLPSSIGDLFHGREDLLAELDERLAAGSPTALVQAQAVNGLGGIGKTRLAVEYAWRRADRYSAFFFVVADSEANLRRNLAALAGADLLDLGCDAALPEDLVLKEVRKALREKPGWLAIFDNVDSAEAQQAVQKILPLQGGRVLITSRLQVWPAGTRPILVEKLSAEAARDYLLQAAERRKTREDDDECALLLAEKVEYLPLALELIAAYLGERRLSFRRLLDSWEDEQERVTTWYHPGAVRYPRSLAAAWTLCFEMLSPGARAVLYVLSHFAAEPIAQAMLEQGEGLLRQAAGGELDLPGALAELERCSLVRREGENLILHRLVQAVALGRIPEVEKQEWSDRAVRVVLAYAPEAPDDVRTWPIWDPLRPHAARAVELAGKLGPTSATSHLMNELGQLLGSKALYAEAEPLMRRALEIDQASFGTDHPDVAIDLNNLAQLLQATNRPDEAEPLMRRALEIDQASFGTDHPKVAIRLNNLAGLLQATNRLDEAEPLMRRALEIDQASCGTDHPDVARDLNNLAQLLKTTNRLDEAEPLMRRALEIDQASFGTEHPDVARDLNNLAQLLQATDRLDEAEPLMRRALEIVQASFGTDHPRVAVPLNNLASLLQDTNRLDEAEPLMRRALEIDQASFGTEHPNVARDLNNLAFLLQATNRLEEAEPLLRRAAGIFASSLGPDHPWTKAVEENLEVLLNLKKARSGD
jgi:tetratricopeptide (TPR) repeat protein